MIRRSLVVAESAVSSLKGTFFLSWICTYAQHLVRGRLGSRRSVDDLSEDDLSVDDLSVDDLSVDDSCVDDLSLDDLSVYNLSVDVLLDVWSIHRAPYNLKQYNRCSSSNLSSICFICS